MTIIERLTHEAVQLDPDDPRRIVMQDAIVRLKWFEASGGVAVHTRVHQQQSELDRLTAERDEMSAESVALREMLTLYNLGGWQDGLGPMKRALKAEAENARLKAALEQAAAVAKHQARGASADMRIAVHPLTCGVDSRHAPLYPWWTGSRLVLACIDCEYLQDIPAALRGEGREPSSIPAEKLDDDSDPPPVCEGCGKPTERGYYTTDDVRLCEPCYDNLAAEGEGREGAR